MNMLIQYKICSNIAVITLQCCCNMQWCCNVVALLLPLCAVRVEAHIFQPHLCHLFIYTSSSSSKILSPFATFSTFFFVHFFLYILFLHFCIFLYLFSALFLHIFYTFLYLFCIFFDTFFSFFTFFSHFYYTFLALLLHLSYTFPALFLHLYYISHISSVLISHFLHFSISLFRNSRYCTSSGPCPHHLYIPLYFFHICSISLRVISAHLPHFFCISSTPFKYHFNIISVSFRHFFLHLFRISSQRFSMSFTSLLYFFRILSVCINYLHIYLYRVSHNSSDNARGQMERNKLSRKVLYHFAIFAIANKIFSKNCWILVFNNFFLKYYQLYRKTARNENYLFSFHKVLKFFSEFFQIF